MTETALRSSAEKRWFNLDMRALSPFIALIVLVIAGALINPDFLTASNLRAVVLCLAVIALSLVAAVVGTVGAAAALRHAE